MPMMDLSPWLTSPLAIVKVVQETDATNGRKRGDGVKAECQEMEETLHRDGQEERKEEEKKRKREGEEGGKGTKKNTCC